MSLKKRKVKDLYLYDTQIENIFINEYLPQAKGDYVRVYIYASMYAGFGMETDSKTIAEQLGITREKVKEAWECVDPVDLRGLVELLRNLLDRHQEEPSPWSGR